MENWNGSEMDELRKFFNEHPIGEYNLEQLSEYLKMPESKLKTMLKVLEHENHIVFKNGWSLKNTDGIKLPESVNIDVMFKHNQESNRIHPYTCVTHSETPLVLNKNCDTMECPKCDYKQQFYASDRTFTIQLYQTLTTTKDWKERLAESEQKEKCNDCIYLGLDCDGVKGDDYPNCFVDESKQGDTE